MPDIKKHFTYNHICEHEPQRTPRGLVLGSRSSWGSRAPGEPPAQKAKEAAMKLLCWLLAAEIIVAIPLRADDCADKADHRSDKSGGIMIRDFVISGTRALDSAELSEISGTFIGSCFDDTEELPERLRLEFQDRGFFTVKVEGVSIKPEDPLGLPKPVTVNVEVEEGPRYQLSKLSLAGNRSFTSKEVQATLPLHVGDRFARDKVAMGLEGLRQLYLTDGYIDITVIPDTLLDSNGTVALDLEIDEGRQYHMGKFTVVGKKELADPLQSGWGLQEGAVFDQTYVEKYLTENKAMLGESFDRSHGVQIIRNCRNNTTAVRLLLPGTPELFSPIPPDIDCDKNDPDKTN